MLSAGGRGTGTTWTGARKSLRDLLPSARWQVVTSERLGLRWRLPGATCAMKRGEGARVEVCGARLCENPYHPRVCSHGAA
eukprot:5906579-Lingulodinium_polyedra.AAC.1